MELSEDMCKHLWKLLAFSGNLILGAAVRHLWNSVWLLILFKFTKIRYQHNNKAKESKVEQQKTQLPQRQRAMRM